MAGDENIRALALDQAPRSTGWAVGSPCEKTPLYGLFSLPSWSDHGGKRMYQFCEWLRGMIDTHAITHVFMEAPAFFDRHQKDARVTMTQGGQNYAIEMICFAAGVDVMEIDVNEMRKRFIGTAKAPPGLTRDDSNRAWLKQAALKGCALRGWLVEDDNIAEALGHLDYGLSTLSKRHASQSDVIFHRLENSIATKRFRGEWHA